MIKNTQKGFSSIAIILLILVFGVGAWVVKSGKDKAEGGEEKVACTMDAKACPDGSYVGRTGPHCEFEQCPTESASSGQGSVSGQVTLSPSCPGPERTPPDSNCGPKPYATSISIIKSGTSKIFKTIQSNASGAFSVSLDAGAYIFKAQGGSVLPTCAEVTVNVKSGANTNVDISCDSGIR